MTELLVGISGLLLGHWLGQRRARHELLLNAKVEATVSFVDKAYECLGDIALGAPPAGAGPRKQLLTLAGHRLWLFVGDTLGKEIDDFTTEYTRALMRVADPDPDDRRSAAFTEVKGSLESLRGSLKRELDGLPWWYRRGDPSRLLQR